MGRDITDDDPQRMLGRGVLITKRQDQETMGVIDTTADPFDHIESGLVGPMDVIDHDDSGTCPPIQQIGKNTAKFMAVPGLQHRQNLRLLVDHIPKGFQRPRSQKVITRPHQHVNPLTMSIDKRPE